MSKKCSECDEYERIGHNYCRMCGYHIRKGFVNNARIAVTYHTGEKFCGYCGESRDKCAC